MFCLQIAFEISEVADHKFVAVGHKAVVEPSCPVRFVGHTQVVVVVAHQWSVGLAYRIGRNLLH